MMNGYAMSAWGWLLMTLGLLGFWALVAVLALALLGAPGQPDQQPQPGAEEIMALRLARGEIDAEEYRQLLLDRGAQHRLVRVPVHWSQSMPADSPAEVMNLPSSTHRSGR